MSPDRLLAVRVAVLAVVTAGLVLGVGGAQAQSVGPALDVNQTLNRTNVSAGDALGVNVSLNATDPTFEGPAINASPPVGWPVTPSIDDGGSYKDTVSSWVWESKAAVKQVRYVLQVPTGAGGQFWVNATGSAIDTTVPPDGDRVTDDAATLVTVNALPSAGISFTPPQPGVNETVVFNSTSSDPDGSIASIDWSFGDGDTATGENVTHSYGSEGTFSVTLTVTDDDGATASTTVDVPVGNDPPDAVIAVNETAPTTGDAVAFDASGSSDPDGSIASVDWDFGDGNGSTAVTATNSYATAGTFVVTLTVTDDDGATSVATTTIDVSSPAPGDDAGPVFGVGGGGSGGGDVGAAQPPAQPAPSGPTQVQSPGGAGPANEPPVANFTATPVPNASDDLYRFDGSTSRDPDGVVERYGWDLDGDGVFEHGGTVVTDQLEPGENVVTLRVMDDAGAANATSRTVTVPRPEQVEVPDQPRSTVDPLWILLLVLAALVVYGARRYGREE